MRLTLYVQDAVELQQVDAQEINDVMQGLAISRQLGDLAATMKEAQERNPGYVPSIPKLFAVLANVERVILFSLKTNLNPSIRNADQARLKRRSHSHRRNFHQFCDTLGELGHFMHRPHSAHQQILCEQGVLGTLFSILSVLTKTLQSLRANVPSLKTSAEQKVQRNNPLRRWNKIRSSVGHRQVSFTNIARQEHNKLRFGDVQSLCKLLFLAISAICSHNSQAEISASKWMSFMLETLLNGLTDLGADDCLTRMLDHNEYLLHHLVTRKHIQLIVQVCKCFERNSRPEYCTT